MWKKYPNWFSQCILKLDYTLIKVLIKFLKKWWIIYFLQNNIITLSQFKSKLIS
jgi:hypothetical protein